MDKLLETYNLPRLNHDDIEYLNRSIPSNEIESAMKKLPKSRTRTIHKGILLNIYSSQTIPQNFRGGNASKLIVWGQHHPHIKTRQIYQTHICKTYRLITMMNIDTNIFNKILANWIKQYIKRRIHHDQVGFISDMQG